MGGRRGFYLEAARVIGGEDLPHKEKDFQVEYNARLRGALSGQMRQVDILVTEVAGGTRGIVAVDC